MAPDDGMKITIREMSAADRAAWAQMRGELWPEDTEQAHAAGIDEWLRDGDAWGFVAETADGASAGFAELAIRKYANGCTARPVPFLEGIWVTPEFRRQRIGTRLIEHVTAFAAARGFREMGSDSELENRTSHAAHRSLGIFRDGTGRLFSKAATGQVSAAF
jgi:aminoglycoside 6'-N-acetyltransferase I